MTKSEQQTVRITRVYLHGNGSTKGLYTGACSLDREKLTRESRGSKEGTCAESSESPDSLLT